MVSLSTIWDGWECPTWLSMHLPTLPPRGELTEKEKTVRIGKKTVVRIVKEESSSRCKFISLPTSYLIGLSSPTAQMLTFQEDRIIKETCFETVFSWRNVFKAQKGVVVVLKNTCYTLVVIAVLFILSTVSTLEQRAVFMLVAHLGSYHCSVDEIYISSLSKIFV